MNEIAKALRKRSTDTETLLWRHLRLKQIEGLKFMRQEPMSRYIVDFVCHEKRIVIEVDGSQHLTDKGTDAERDKWLNEQGYKVLRFWNNEVLKNIAGVLEVIRENCLKHPPLTPPIKGGEIIAEASIEGGVKQRLTSQVWNSMESQEKNLKEKETEKEKGGYIDEKCDLWTLFHDKDINPAKK